VLVELTSSSIGFLTSFIASSPSYFILCQLLLLLWNLPIKINNLIILLFCFFFFSFFNWLCRGDSFYAELWELTKAACYEYLTNKPFKHFLRNLGAFTEIEGDCVLLLKLSIWNRICLKFIDSLTVTIWNNDHQKLKYPKKNEHNQKKQIYSDLLKVKEYNWKISLEQNYSYLFYNSFTYLFSKTIFEIS